MRKILLIAAMAVSLCTGTAMAFFGQFSLKFSNTPTGGGYVDLLPSLSWSPTSHDYGTQDTGTVTNYSYTISNTGNDTAEDVAVSVTGTAFRLYSTLTFGDIPAGQTRVAKVQFKPVTGGAFTGFLNYTAPNIARVGAALSGTGLSSYLVQDFFTTDSSANYTQLNASYSMIWDSVNQRMKGASSNQRQGLHHNTPSSTDNYTITAKIYAANLASAESGGLIWNCNGAGATSTGYWMQPTATYFNVYKFASGISAAGTNITGWGYSGGKTWANNTSHLVRMVVTGNSKRVYVDWNDDTDFDDADENLGLLTDASYAGRYFGVYVYTGSGAPWVDNLEVTVQ